MWLYKDKDGDGVRLNNGDEGAGDWLFHKNGHFHSPAAIHAASATLQEDGNIHGSVWGGHISGWIIARANDALRSSADFSVDGNNWWFRDNRRGLIFQGGYRDGQASDKVIERVGLNIPVPNRLLYVSTTIVNFAQGYDTTWNHQVANLSGERDGFTWIHGWKEQKMYWMVVGY